MKLDSNTTVAKTPSLDPVKTNPASVEKARAQAEIAASQAPVKDGQVVNQQHQTPDAGSKFPGQDAGDRRGGDSLSHVAGVGDDPGSIHKGPATDGHVGTKAGSQYNHFDNFNNKLGSHISNRAAGTGPTVGGGIDAYTSVGPAGGPIGIGKTAYTTLTDPSVTNFADYTAAVAAASPHPLLKVFGAAYGLTRLADETTGAGDALVDLLVDALEEDVPGYEEPGTGETPDPTPPAAGEDQSGAGDVPDPQADAGSGEGQSGSEGGGQQDDNGQSQGEQGQGGGSDGDDDDGGNSDDGSGDGDSGTDDDGGTDADDHDNQQPEDDGSQDAAAEEAESSGGNDGDSTPNPDDPTGDDPNGGWHGPTPESNPNAGTIQDADYYTGNPGEPGAGRPSVEQIADRLAVLNERGGGHLDPLINYGDTTDGGPAGPLPDDVDQPVPVTDPASPNAQ